MSRFVTSNCPNCDKLATRETYDIGSGPELSCAECEWCWGADGQPLHPAEMPDYVVRDGHLIPEALADAQDISDLLPLPEKKEPIMSSPDPIDAFDLQTLAEAAEALVASVHPVILDTTPPPEIADYVAVPAQLVRDLRDALEVAQVGPDDGLRLAGHEDVGGPTPGARA